MTAEDPDYAFADTECGRVRGLWREAGTLRASAAFLGIPGSSQMSG